MQCLISFIWGFCLWLNMTLTLSCLVLRDSLLHVQTDYHVIRSVGFTHPVNFQILTHTYLYSPSVCECEQQENAVSPVVMLMHVYECVCVGFVEKLKAQFRV